MGSNKNSSKRATSLQNDEENSGAFGFLSDISGNEEKALY